MQPHAGPAGLAVPSPEPALEGAVTGPGDSSARPATQGWVSGAAPTQGAACTSHPAAAAHRTLPSTPKPVSQRSQPHAHTPPSVQHSTQGAVGLSCAGQRHAALSPQAPTLDRPLPGDSEHPGVSGRRACGWGRPRDAAGTPSMPRLSGASRTPWPGAAPAGCPRPLRPQTFPSNNKSRTERAARQTGVRERSAREVCPKKGPGSLRPRPAHWPQGSSGHTPGVPQDPAPGALRVHTPWGPAGPAPRPAPRSAGTESAGT